MKVLLKSRIEEIFITLATSLCGLLLFTPTLDDVGSFFESLANAQYSNFPFLNYHYLALIAIHPAYKYLYQLSPNYNWLGISFLALQIIGLYLLLRSIKVVIFNNNSTLSYMIRLLQLFVTVVYIGNICSISHTRSSLLFCGISLFNLAFKQQLRKKDYVLNGLLFLTGMLYRPEGSLGMFLLVSSGFLIYRFAPKQLFIRLWIPLLSLITMLGIVSANWTTTDIYMEKIEPEIEYKMMDKRIVPLSNMKTAKDSIKYELGIKGIWLDPEVLTPDFLRSIQLNGINTSMGHIHQVFNHVLDLYCYYPFVILLLIALLLYGNIKGNKRFAQLLLFNGAVFVLLFASDYNGLLITHRHFLNIQLVALLIALSYVFSNETSKLTTQKASSKLGYISIASLLIIGSGFTLKHYIITNRTEVQKTECEMATMAKIDEQFNNRTIVVTMPGIPLFNKTYSWKNKCYNNNHYLIYDAFTYSLIPEYSTYLDKECACNSIQPKAFYQWLSSQNALYIADNERFALTEKYMYIIHHLPILFNPVSDFKLLPCKENTEFNTIDIREVTIRK